MSWQSFVDDQLIATKVIHRAAILGLAGEVWAKSGGYELSNQEQTAVVKAFENPDDVQARGIRLAGQKFFTLSASQRSIYGKKQADGCILVKTEKAVLVAEYVAPVQQAEAVQVVEKLADYLIGAGF